ncbi:MAG: tetratricopeptide repeat protein [Planctomycetota bacterium]
MAAPGARALFALEDASAAEAAVQAALEVAPTDAELHLLRARIQVAREDFPGALASLSEAIVCGGGPAAEFVRVDVRRASGDSEGAAAELERITSRHPTLREGWERRLRLAGDEYEAQRTVLDQALRCLPEDTAFLARRAELLVGLERDEEAQADLLRARALGSRSPRLLLVRSRLRRHADDGEGALADALAALRPALDQGPAWREVGYSLAHRGDYAASHVALVQAHAFQPRDLPTRTVLAQVKVALSDFEQASRLLEAALATRTPTIPGPLGILADAYIGQERYAEAEATLGFVLGYESADQGLYRGKRGMVRVELERDALAVPDLRAGLASSPADPQLWAYLAAALANLGRDEEALDALRRAIVCGAERDVPMVFNLAKLALRLERWEEARVELAELCRRTPEDGESHYQLARCALKLGDWAAGLAPARRALELDPDSLSAQLVLTELLMNLGEHAQALEVLDSAIGQHPDARGPRRARVDVLNALGRPEDALAGLDAYLERWPDDAGALGNRAGLRSTLEDYAGAEADVARALELDPYDVAARYNRAHLHLRADRFVDVLVDVAVILARDPHDFDAWCLRVEGLRYLGRRYEALATAEAALQAQPDHPHARWAQALIEDLR